MRLRHRFSAACIAGALAACAGPAPVVRPPPPPITAVLPPRPPLPTTPRQVLASADLPDGAVGYALVDPATSEVVEQQQGARGFLPGSVAKLASIAAALEVLGLEHRFRTLLARTGPIRGGVLEGDLVLRGGGDPLLSVADLMSLAHALRSAGVVGIRGRFLYDETLYAPPQRIADDQDDDASYDPVVGALSLELNRIAVHWRPQRDGAVAAWTVPGRARLGLQAEPEPVRFAHVPQESPDAWALSPTLPHRGDERLPVWRPGEHAARVFAQLARGLGTSLPEPQPGPLPQAAQPIAEHASAPLVELAQTTLLNSENTAAELISLAVARRVLGRPPTLADAGEAITAHFRKKGIELLLPNGSGLSDAARLSPLAACGLLLDSTRRSAGRPFFTLLPASGVSGTLARRLGTPDVALRAWAKTGTMAYGSGIAGHLFARSGRELLFAVFVNDLEARARARAHRPTTLAEAEARDQAEDRFAAIARSVQDALVTLWIARY